MPRDRNLPRLSQFAFLGFLLGVALLYSGTFRTPWVYDDIEGIRQNPALLDATRLGQIFGANPPDSTPYGRPLVALSLALNHAVSGFSPWSYRLVNLGFHLLAALILADLVRHCLRVRPCFDETMVERCARWAALLWAAHPLATTVVTYTVQRAEGLMALLYLGTLAAAARGLALGGRRRWLVLAVGLCALGMLAKETIVTAPLAVLLLHRGFFAGSWREVGRRWRWYVCLAATWALLAGCMAAWPRSQSVGFGFEDMGALDYLSLQTGAWWHYLSIVFAPWRIAIDHWPAPVSPVAAVILGLLFASLYISAIVLAWRLSVAWGVGLILPGLALLPTSTLIPICTSPVADHRMYLPAAVALALGVVAVGRFVPRFPRFAAIYFWFVFAALATATVMRNRVFQSESSVWADAVAQEPQNARALNNLGMALAGEGRSAEGEAAIVRALALKPGYPDAWYNLGTLQGRDARLASAEESFRRSISLRPAYPAVHCNLAVVLWRRGQKDAAIRHYEEAIRLRPDYPAANFNLAVIYFDRGDYARALDHAQRCLRGDPDYPKAQNLVDDLMRLVHAVDSPAGVPY